MADETTQSGIFTVPANQPTGTATVQIIGDQGSSGIATYAAGHDITTEMRRIVTTVTQYYDPLAETFSLTEGRYIAGLDLWFTAKGQSRVVVQIRDTLVGFPNKNVLAQATLYPKDIKTDGNATRFTFRPIWLDANVEYAIVILTDDAETAVAIAELGQYDSVHQNHVTRQPYQTGVLLSSSNASSWTAHQTMDLTFRLLGCKFTETNHEVSLGGVAANAHTDLLVLGQVERVSTDTDVEFVITDETGKENVISEESAISLQEELSGDVSLKARLKGTTKHSPMLFKGVQLLLGKMAQTADYVTRAIPAGINTTIRIMFDSYTPGNSNVKVYYQQQDSSWTLVPLSSGSNIGNGLEERVHIVESFNGSSTRIKLVLEGNVQYRPYVKNLKVTTV